MQSVGRVMRAQTRLPGLEYTGIIVNVVKLPANAPASFIASRAGLAAMTERANAELNLAGVRVFAVLDENPLESVLAGCRA